MNSNDNYYNQWSGDRSARREDTNDDDGEGGDVDRSHENEWEKVRNKK